MEYSIVENNIVINVVVADSPLGSNWHEGNHGMGAVYDPATGTFALPPQPTPEPLPLSKHISVGSFFDRFGQHKYPILASADPMVKALIQDCSVRSYIDLDNAQLPYGLDMLIAAGFAIDKEAILTAPVTASEAPG